MKILISPAKKMNQNTDSLPITGIPKRMEDTKILMQAIRKLSFAQAKALWKCNDALAELNYRRFRKMNLERGLTPAILSYEGLQYKHIAPEVFTREALSYLDKHLRILSGFYGVLKPFDGVTPYRLEMQAKLSVKGSENLYEFWGEHLYEEIIDEDRVIVNLASAEYSRCIEKYLQPEDHFVSIIFGEENHGKIKQKGTLAKMARGEMVRFMAENAICHLEGMKQFKELGFQFKEELSSEEKYVFLKEELRSRRKRT